MNTCSIRSLKNAHIGVRVRMSKDKSTVPFENIPMKGIEITNYSSDGFKIKHPNFPKEVWVDFEQLPLTRLSIKNGIIEDELTFVENIVRHQMQLIKTYDTEYIDMLYAEKQLKKIENEIIPISKAKCGYFYKSAVCKDAVEMIYLGSFYTKKFIRTTRGYGYRDSYAKNYLNIETPKVAYFAVKDAKKSNIFELISFADSNKMVKELFCLSDSPIKEFDDIEINRQNIFQSFNNLKVANGGEYAYLTKEDIVKENTAFLDPSEEVKKFTYQLNTSKIWRGPKLISITKPTNLEAKEFIEKTFNIKLENELVRGSSSYSCSFTKKYINE